MAGWAVGIDKIVAAARGDLEAKAMVNEHLAAYALTTRRTGLVDALRCIAGGRADSGLLADRDPLESAILRAIFSRLGSASLRTAPQGLRPRPQ